MAIGQRKNTTAAMATSGPTPSHRDNRAATAAPSTPPDAPMPSARPMVPAERPRLRLANSTSSAEPMKLKKLTVAAQPSDGAQIGMAQQITHAAARPLQHRLAAVLEWRRGAIFSRAIWIAEKTKDNASTMIAAGAASHWIRRPASAGPPT